MKEVSMAAMDDVGVWRERIFDLVERRRRRTPRGSVGHDGRGNENARGSEPSAEKKDVEMRIVNPAAPRRRFCILSPTSQEFNWQARKSGHQPDL